MKEMKEMKIMKVIKKQEESERDDVRESKEGGESNEGVEDEREKDSEGGRRRIRVNQRELQGEEVGWGKEEKDVDEEIYTA